MNNLPTDEELVALSLRTPDRFGELVERYASKIESYVHRLTNFATEEIEDLVQDIFIKAYRNLNSFDRSLKFSSWIYRIAHNEAISLYRHHTSRPETVALDKDREDSDDQSWLEVLDDGTNLEQELNSKINSQIVRHALLQLPAHYRDILLLRYVEDKSYEEIGDILKKPAGTVATHLNRAKNELKSLLTKYYGSHQ